MMEIYYIGGLPCSGKSTIAELISRKYDLHYFKVDDFLDKYTEIGAEKGKPIYIKQKSMTPNQIWMRYQAFVNDGSISIDVLVKKVTLQFGLEK